ncbi:MAG: cysteine-rich CWC family protein [Chloroflexota bacterium]
MDSERKISFGTRTGARICPQCGAVFTCAFTPGDLTSPDARCWCFDLPPMLPVRAETACLCPACLTSAIQQAQEIKQ